MGAFNIEELGEVHIVVSNTTAFVGRLLVKGVVLGAGSGGGDEGGVGRKGRRRREDEEGDEEDEGGGEGEKVHGGL